MYTCLCLLWSLQNRFLYVICRQDWLYIKHEHMNINPRLSHTKLNKTAALGKYPSKYHKPAEWFFWLTSRDLCALPAERIWLSLNWFSIAAYYNLSTATFYGSWGTWVCSLYVASEDLRVVFLSLFINTRFGRRGVGDGGSVLTHWVFEG